MKGKIESLSSSPATRSVPHFLFLLLLFFTVSQLGFHFWPDFAFIDGIRIDYLSPTLYFSDVVFVALAITSLPTIKKELSQKAGRVVLIFMALFFFRTFFQDSSLLGLASLLRIAQLVILILLSKQFFSEVVFHRAISHTLAIGLLTVSALTFLQLVFQGSIGGFWYFLGERTFSGSTPGIANASLLGNLVLRPYASFPHPNVLGGFIVVYVILLISLIRKQVVSVGEFIVFLSIILSSVVATFATLSRSAVIAGAISFVLLLSFFGQQKKNLIILLIVVLAVLTIFLNTPILVSRFMYFSPGDTSFSIRLVLFNQALALFQVNLLFGVGLGEFLPSLQRTFSPTYSYLQPVHNALLLFLVESGLLGLVAILASAARILKSIWSTTYFKKEKAILFCAIILICCVDHYFYSLQQGKLLLGLAIGFMLSGPAVFVRGKAKNTDRLIDELD